MSQQTGKLFFFRFFFLPYTLIGCSFVTREKKTRSNIHHNHHYRHHHNHIVIESNLVAITINTHTRTHISSHQNRCRFLDRIFFFFFWLKDKKTKLVWVSHSEWRKNTQVSSQSSILFAWSLRSTDRMETDRQIESFECSR